jgi:hypothetical protein
MRTGHIMRVRSTLGLAIGLVGFIVTLVACQPPVLAQDLRLLPQPPAFAKPKAPQPFGNLFGRERPSKPQPALLFKTLARPALERVAPPSTIACPMRLVPADPSLDASIRHAVPENGPAFTMRVAPPLACRP